MFLEKRLLHEQSSESSKQMDKSAWVASNNEMSAGRDTYESAKELTIHTRQQEIEQYFGKILLDFPLLQRNIDAVQSEKTVVQEIFKDRFWERTFHPSHIRIIEEHFEKNSLIQNYLQTISSGGLTQEAINDEWHILAREMREELETLVEKKWDKSLYDFVELAIVSNGNFNGVEMDTLFTSLRAQFKEKNGYFEEVSDFQDGTDSVDQGKEKMKGYAVEHKESFESIVHTAVHQNSPELDERKETILSQKNAIINGKSDYFYEWIDFDGAKRPTGIMFSVYKEVLMHDLDQVGAKNSKKIEKLSTEFDATDSRIFVISKFLEKTPDFAMNSVYSELLSYYKKQRKRILKNLEDQKEKLKKEKNKDGIEHSFLSDQIRFGVRLDPKYIDVLKKIYRDGITVDQLKNHDIKAYKKYEELRHIVGQIFDLQYINKGTISQVMMAQATNAQDFLVFQQFLDQQTLDWQKTHNQEIKEDIKIIQNESKGSQKKQKKQIEKLKQEKVSQEEVNGYTDKISLCALFENEDVTTPEGIENVLHMLWKEWGIQRGVQFFEKKVSELFFAGSDLSKGMSQPAARLQVEYAALAIEKFNIEFGQDIRIKLGSGEALFRQLGYIDTQAYESFIRAKILYPEKFCVDKNGNKDKEQVDEAKAAQKKLAADFGPNWRERLTKDPRGVHEIFEKNPLINSITAQSRSQEQALEMSPSQFLHLLQSLGDVKASTTTFREDTRDTITKSLKKEGLFSLHSSLEKLHYQSREEEFVLCVEDLEKMVEGDEITKKEKEEILDRKKQRDTIIQKGFEKNNLTPTKEYEIYAQSTKKYYHEVIGDETKDVVKPMGTSGLAANIEIFGKYLTNAIRERATAREGSKEYSAITAYVTLAHVGIDARCIAANTNSNELFPLALVGMGTGIVAVKGSKDANYTNFLENDLPIVDILTQIRDYAEKAPLVFTAIEDAGNKELADQLKEEWSKIQNIYPDLLGVLKRRIEQKKIYKDEHPLDDYIQEKIDADSAYEVVERDKRDIKNKKLCRSDFLKLLSEEKHQDSSDTLKSENDNKENKENIAEYMTPLWRSFFEIDLNNINFSTKKQIASRGIMKHGSAKIITAVTEYLVQGKDLSEAIEEIIVDALRTENDIDDDDLQTVNGIKAYLPSKGEKDENPLHLFGREISSPQDIQKIMRQMIGNILEEEESLTLKIPKEVRKTIDTLINTVKDIENSLTEDLKKENSEALFYSAINKGVGG